MNIVRRAQGDTGNCYRIARGTIKADRSPGTLVWARAEGRVFITCKSCNAINDITGHQSEHRYYANRLDDSSCFVCTHCHTHYFFRLLDWDIPEVAKCDSCGNTKFVTDKGEIRRLRKQGWMVDLKKWSGTRCPICVKAHGRQK